jgi:hypothetical protein
MASIMISNNSQQFGMRGVLLFIDEAHNSFPFFIPENKPGEIK